MRILLLCLPILLCASDTLSQISEADGLKPHQTVFSGKEIVSMKNKKKMMGVMCEWASVRVEFPGVVFSTIKSNDDSLLLSGLTEVPSVKNLHPITFKILLIPQKKKFHYKAYDFKFADIDLMFDEWLLKYKDSENERNQKNVSMVSAGIASHINLSMINLAEKINK